MQRSWHPSASFFGFNPRERVAQLLFELLHIILRYWVLLAVIDVAAVAVTITILVTVSVIATVTIGVAIIIVAVAIAVTSFCRNSIDNDTQQLRVYRFQYACCTGSKVASRCAVVAWSTQHHQRRPQLLLDQKQPTGGGVSTMMTSYLSRSTSISSWKRAQLSSSAGLLGRRPPGMIDRLATLLV